MVALLTTTFVKSVLITLSVGVLVGCSSNGLTEVTSSSTPRDADSNRLSAVDTAHPDLQGFLDEWHKEGVTISESTGNSTSQLVAFTDANGNGRQDGFEPVLAEVPGEISDIEQVAFTELPSGTVTGLCYTNSYEVRPGEYIHRGKTFMVTWQGVHIGFDSCELDLGLSSEAFPGEVWTGFLKGTKNGVPFVDGWLTLVPKTSAWIEIPWPTGKEILDDVYGKVGELSVASMPEDHDPEYFPEDRMIIGSWKSEVTFSN